MRPLLSHTEPPAFQLEREHGPSAFFLICDHAGARIPSELADLGVAASDLERHIAWDIGAAAVARELAGLLDASLILQNYSRLVIDCNRPIGNPASIVTSSENTRIPGNESLNDDDAARRAREVFEPYHDRIAQLLDSRQSRGQATVLVSMHSFTPVFLGKSRPWHVGVLYNRDTRLAHALLHELRSDATLVVGDNEPYAVGDDSDYAIPIYGERRGLLHVEIEIRQDLVTAAPGQHEWAVRLSAALTRACARLG